MARRTLHIGVFTLVLAAAWLLGRMAIPPRIPDVAAEVDVYTITGGAPDAPKLLVRSAGDHLTVRGALGNRQRWRVAGDELILMAISKEGEILDWSYSNPFLCGPEPAPPTPAPAPGPGPQPTPAPVRQSLWITVVHESADRTPAFMAAVASPAVDTAMKAGGHHFRLVDQDAKDEKGQVPSYLAGYLGRAKAKGLPYVFFTDDAGKPIWEGPAPKTEAETLSLIRQYGGAK